MQKWHKNEHDSNTKKVGELFRRYRLLIRLSSFLTKIQRWEPLLGRGQRRKGEITETWFKCFDSLVKESELLQAFAHFNPCSNSLNSFLHYFNRRVSSLESWMSRACHTDKKKKKWKTSGEQEIVYIQISVIYLFYLNFPTFIFH